MDGKSISGFLTWYIAFLVAAIVHEAAHALAALWGGDDTGYRGGQVSLNPLPHIRREPLGMILAPILAYFTMGMSLGWASTPYDPAWAKRYPLRQAAMSAAGPLANLLTAALIFLAFKALILFLAFQPLMGGGDPEGSWANTLARVFFILMYMNLILFLFNLIPLPPLDGSGILAGLFPRSIGHIVDLMKYDSMIIMLCILVAWRFFGPINEMALGWILSLLRA